MADFSIVRKGYDQDEVDEYIEKLECIITSYKEKDIAIKNAIISAQVAADNIVENAELAAAAKKRKTEEMLTRLQKDVDKYEGILTSFEYDYNRMLKKYVKEVNDVEFKESFEKLKELKASVGLIEDNLSGNNLSSNNFSGDNMSSNGISANTMSIPNIDSSTKIHENLNSVKTKELLSNKISENFNAEKTKELLKIKDSEVFFDNDN